MKYISLVLPLLLLTACTSQPQPSRAPEATNTVTERPAPTLPSPGAEKTPDPMQTPIITSPQANTTVSSPLSVTGTVPPGWMFEGTALVKLADDEGNNITSAPANEKTPGSWQSGKPVEFSATITFQTTAKSGFLIIEADNPSGLPENAKSFMIPVTF